MQIYYSLVRGILEVGNQLVISEGTDTVATSYIFPFGKSIYTLCSSAISTCHHWFADNSAKTSPWFVTPSLGFSNHACIYYGMSGIPP